MSPTKKHDQFHCSIWASKVICFWKIRKLFQSDRNFLPSYVDPAISMPCCCLAWYLPYVFQMFSRFGGKNICTTDTWVETQGSWVQAALTPNWNSQVFGWIIMCHLVSTFVIGPRTPLVVKNTIYTHRKFGCELPACCTGYQFAAVSFRQLGVTPCCPWIKGWICLSWRFNNWELIKIMPVSGWACKMYLWCTWLVSKLPLECVSTKLSATS